MIPSTRALPSVALVGDLGAALIAAAITLVAAELIQSSLGVTRLGIIFLAGVTVVASLRGSRAAILAAIISVVTYKYFLDLRLNDYTKTAEDLLNVVIFLFVALITGTLAGKVHDEAAMARRHAERTELLFRTSRTLSETDEHGFWTVVTEAVRRGSGGASIALDGDGEVQAQSGTPQSPATAIELGAQVLQTRSRSNHARNESWRAWRMPDQEPFQGVLLWESHGAPSGAVGFVELVVDLASASLARSRIREEQVRTQAAEEAGKLREALLSSISHDFRSPLAAIIGSATSLLEYGDKFNQPVRTDLLMNIRDEGERLNQFVANLLNMTRLQSGVLQPNKKIVKAADVIGAAVEQLERRQPGAMNIEIDADCAVAADPLLLEQALYNVLDNAAKYAASPSGIRASCINHDQRSEILIVDNGPGLPPEDQAEVFTPFHFVRKNGQTNGTGLGLSISRGFVSAMGGAIEARNRTDGKSGLEIAITLPRSLA
jgi:two-component system sensor histidine kinase KdpD